MDNKIYIQNTFKVENAAEDDKFIRINGYACMFNKVNLNGEMVDKDSFSHWFGMYEKGDIKPYFNFEHTETTIGGIDDVTCDETGLIMKAHLTKGVKIVDDMIAPLVLSGDLDSLSTEGLVLGGYDGIVELPDDNYYVKNFILLGVSIVRTPACPQAKFTLENFIKEYKEHKQSEAEEIAKRASMNALLLL